MTKRQRLCGGADLKRIRQMNGPNQLGAVSDPTGKRAARALSVETRENGRRVRARGVAGGAGGSRGCVRRSWPRIDRARSVWFSTPGRPARARV
ncbi:unnamed protein product [Colias eurytheme]|nr:unnamed protein product [Colias eurytheme]